MRIVLALLALSAATPALAKDEAPCARNTVCASDPPSVAGALLKRGYQGLISKDNSGDPMVESAANGYRFFVYFYGCEANKQCDSLQFYAAFKNEDKRGIDFVNDWNVSKRFLQMSIDKDGDLLLRYDVATIGGLTQRNFDDVIDWWTSMLGSYDKFLAEHPVATPATTPRT